MTATKKKPAAMLETLTAAQERLLEKVEAEYISDITATPKAPDKKAIRRWLDVVYGQLYDGMKVPKRVEICPSLDAALKLANELDPEGKHTAADDAGFGDGGWLSFYDYFMRISVIDATGVEEKMLMALVEFRRTCWDTVLFDECAIVIARPTAIRVDDQGQLHGVKQPCIEWADGTKEYAWHGTWVAERIVMDPRSYTAEEYKAIANTEERRALGESGGWNWLAGLLGAAPISAWTDLATSLEYELLQCSDGSKLLRKQSPKLKDGKQPIYVEPVHENLKTAQAARKWQAVRTWSVEQCERDPVLAYSVEA